MLKVETYVAWIESRLVAVNFILVAAEPGPYRMTSNKAGNGKGKDKGEMRGFLRQAQERLLHGGGCAAFGRDDVVWGAAGATARR